MHSSYYESIYLIFMLVTMIVSWYARFKIKHAFKKYSKIPCSCGMTGAQAAHAVLKHNCVRKVSISSSKGFFTDYFDPISNTIKLSQSVCKKSTIAAVSVAAHEAGHAIQHFTNYSPLKFRNAIVPVSNFGSKAYIPLIILGNVVKSLRFAMTLGIILFALSVLLRLITLPVEINASKRAVEIIQQANILNKDELKGAKKVLTAAALTYVANFLSHLSIL